MSHQKTKQQPKPVVKTDQHSIPCVVRTTNSIITETDQGAVTQPDQGAVTQTDQGAVTQTDQGAVTQPDQGAVPTPADNLKRRKELETELIKSGDKPFDLLKTIYNEELWTKEKVGEKDGYSSFKDYVDKNQEEFPISYSWFMDKLKAEELSQRFKLALTTDPRYKNDPKYAGMNYKDKLLAKLAPSDIQRLRQLKDPQQQIEVFLEVVDLAEVEGKKRKSAKSMVMAVNERLDLIKAKKDHKEPYPEDATIQEWRELKKLKTAHIDPQNSDDLIKQVKDMASTTKTDMALKQVCAKACKFPNRAAVINLSRDSGVPLDILLTRLTNLQKVWDSDVARTKLDEITKAAKADLDEDTEAPVQPTTEAPVQPTTEAPPVAKTEAPVQPTTEAPTKPEVETLESPLVNKIKDCTNVLTKLLDNQEDEREWQSLNLSGWEDIHKVVDDHLDVVYKLMDYIDLNIDRLKQELLKQ